MIIYETLNDNEYQNLLDCYKKVINTDKSNNKEIQETLQYCTERFEDEIYFYLAEKLINK